MNESIGNRVSYLRGALPSVARLETVKRDKLKERRNVCAIVCGESFL